MRLNIVAICALVACGGPSATSSPEAHTVPSVDSVARAVPIMGGGLAVDDGIAVASAPAHGALVVVDVARLAHLGTVALRPDDVPSRVASSDDDAYVVLRGAGAVARVDLAQQVEVGRAEVCSEPRDVVIDGDRVYVTCAGGELVTLDRALAEVDRWHVDSDLRDIVVDGDTVWVSRFLDAEVLQLDLDAHGVRRRVSPALPEDREASVAWRMIPSGEGGVYLLHQSATLKTIALDPLVHAEDLGGARSAYSAGPSCEGGDGPVETHVTEVTPGSDLVTSDRLHRTVLPVDFTVQDHELLVAVAGDSVPRPHLARARAAFVPAAGGCVLPSHEHDGDVGMMVALEATEWGVVSVRRAPFEVWVDGIPVPLADPLAPRPEDVSVHVFHQNAGAGIACASCHPEGQQDGVTWRFDTLGPRRTQLLAGGVLGRAPYHWDAELRDLDHLMDEVFSGRMGGADADSQQIEALGLWMHGLAPVRFPSLEGDPELGRGYFLGAGCDGCHSGPYLTDNRIHAVRRWGPPIKTPSLIAVGARGPWMHDGCATTLLERFTDPPCGGGEHHGDTAGLSAKELQDLVAYLHTL